MAFNITIQDVRVEEVKKGRSSYSIANVVYTFKGTQKEQKLMSFANPQVFKDVQTYKGQEVAVEVAKNDKGYDQWAKISPVGAGSTAPGAPPTPGKVTGSNYETADERKMRQLLIVRQSSITNAIATLTPGAKAALDAELVLALAQKYVDFVYGNEAEATEEFVGQAE